MSCTEYCPKKLSPTRSISGLKREGLWSLLYGKGGKP
jgi:succinate dehydrogenase/fumarate reductase-like Fe-S protein